jgi:predicted nucleotidyltransferase
VRQQLLGILYRNPERSFYSNELIRLANSGIGAVQRELQSLTTAGLITVDRRGNQKHYQANANCPIFGELRGIVAKTLGIPEKLRQALMPLAPQIAWALLYGSAAKDQMHANSDVDLMVISDQLTLEELFQGLAGAEQELRLRINPTLYTVREFRKRRDADQPFLGKVLAGSKVELIGSQDAIA